MGFAYCCDCKKATEVVKDESAGDTICSECGLVLESYSIDETSEWRTFADNSSNIDPVRVGEPTNPLLTQGRFSTVISNSKGSDILWQKKNQEGCNPHDEKLVLVFKNIAIMADRLELVATIKYRANEIYRDARSQKSRHNEDALITACIYLACRQEQLPRKLKEVSSVANGATKNEIVKAAYFCIWCRKAASLSCFPS